MIKKSIVVTVIFIVSTCIQLLSQIVVTRIFGAQLDLDIFLAAVSIPTIMVTVIYGTLNQAFLPLFGEKKVKDPQGADSYFFSTLLYLVGVSLIFSFLLTFFAKPISSALYASRGEEFVQAVSIQMNYLFYSFPLAVIATLLGSYFYVRKMFYRFPLAQALGSMANLIIIFILGPIIGTWSLIIAFLMSILMQIIFVIPRSITKIVLKPINPLPLLIAWLPLIIGSFAIRSDPILIRSFGSQLAPGYLVYLNLIAKIFSIATGVMTVGIQIVLLPHLVEYINTNQYEKAIRNVNRSKIVALGISLVVAFIISLIAPVVIPFLFVGGKFTYQDAQITISLIPLFIFPAIGWGVVEVFFQPLLALKKQLPVGILNFFAFITAWGVATVTNRYFGPLSAITYGLITLLLVCIMGSEILWQIYRRKLKITS